MEELKHTKGPWIMKGDQVISTSVKNIDWSAFGNRAPIGAPDITLICTLPMQMNYKDAPYNGLLISLAPDMIRALIYVYEERDRGVTNGLTDKLIQGTIEQATGMKIQDVLSKVRQDATL